MPLPISERVAKLREEIARISEQNRQYLEEERKTSPGAAGHERRLQRLQEILEELASLTDWRKT
jgi:hypothetical protein